MKPKEEKLFFERHFPELLRQVSRLADAMENQNKLNEKLFLFEKKKYLESTKVNEKSNS